MRFVIRQKFKNVMNLGVLILACLAFAACAPKQVDGQADERPACVTLSSYSGVIQQVMHIQPHWDPIKQVGESHQSQWAVQDDKGSHTLSVALTSDGCVCATKAKSYFSGGFTQGELAGLMQGAAVAPVSDLESTGEWLEPRLLKQCSSAFLRQSSYEDESSMADGTTWRLICSGDPNIGNGKLVTSLTIVTPICPDAFD